MKHLTRYLGTMIIVVVFLITLDLGLMLVVNFATKGNRFTISAEHVSQSISQKDGDYILEKEMQEKMDDINAFLLIIGQDGELNWEYHRPEDVPTKYSLCDVASFSKWYLKDYPVYTWIRDNEILVIGFPKNSLWKYTVEYQLDTLNAMLMAIPYIIIGNILIIVILPLWLTKRWQKRKERQRTEWIAGVSHDIRTPLSIVLGHAKKGGIIEKQCLRIRDLVGNLNTENKLEAGTGKWDEKELKLASLVREIVCDYMNLNQEQYTFDFSMDESIENANIVADETLMRRMIDNLINNAIRHNESGCEIVVSIKSCTKDKVMLCIADNGSGVTEDTLKKLNGRLEHDYLPEHGLGIRVVKQIAKKYRYKVKFRNREEKGLACDILLHAKPE